MIWILQKMCGPDGISGLFVKRCANGIAPRLCALFNHLLIIGC